MFTGIIQSFGTIAGIEHTVNGAKITINTDMVFDDTKAGDSIAVNGSCLTAVTIAKGRFAADISSETLSKTTFTKAKTGDSVNLELALRFSDRLGGHLVSGHVDGIGEIIEKKKTGNAIIIKVKVTKDLSRYMVRKGSVTIDGISLTINECDKYGFAVSIIPHTAEKTTLVKKNAGSIVNIETDLIGKYIEKFVIDRVNETGGDKSTRPVDMELLVKTGFL